LPAIGRLCHPLSRFYEFGIEGHGAAQRTGDAPPPLGEREAVGAGQRPRARRTAEVGATSRQGACGIDHGVPRTPAGVSDGGEAHELGLRRNPPAADAAASGHVDRYGVGPPALL
jgi:putative intracellular protease/amidase